MSKLMNHMIATERTTSWGTTYWATGSGAHGRLADAKKELTARREARPTGRFMIVSKVC